MDTHYDIIIVGAGTTGLTLANCLQNQGFSIAIVEQQLDKVVQGTEDSRPIALSYATQQIYQTVGIWPALQWQATPIHHVHVSLQGQFGSCRFDADEFKVPALGYIVPYGQLQRGLYQQVAQQPTLSWIKSDKLLHITCQANHASLQLQTPTGVITLTAALIVGADGTYSSVRELAGIAANPTPLPYLALTAQVDFSHPVAHHAYERFTPHGTFALLPQPAGCGLVWTVPHTQWEQQSVDALTETALQQRVQQVFGYRLGKVIRVTRTGSYNLHTVSVANPIRSGLVLLGNAAHTFSPVAAQGLNLSVQDVATLVEQLVAAKRAHQRLGDEAVLSAYQARRQHSQQRIQRLTTLIQKAFHPNPLRSLPALGLCAADLCPFTQRYIGRLGLGLAGEWVPKLARGCHV